MSGLVKSLKERRRVSVRPFLLGELFVAFLLLWVYDRVRAFESVRGLPALDHGRDVVSIEKSLHLNFEYDANHWLAHHQTLSTVLVWWYQYSHVAGTMTVLLACYLFFPQMYRAARTGLVLTNCVGLLVFVLLPVMPPRLLPHAGFIDTVAQAGYGTDHGGPVEPAMYGAMPSLHVAWALWVGFVLFAMLRGKRHRGLAFLYPALTTVAVIMTANHYVLDVVCGAALTLAALTVSGFLTYTRAPRPAMAMAEGGPAVATTTAPAPVSSLALGTTVTAPVADATQARPAEATQARPAEATPAEGAPVAASTASGARTRT